MTLEVDPALLRFADDLEAMLDGRGSPEEFVSRYREADVHPTIGAIMGNMWHYLADADIRARDADYREMQEREMHLLIAHVRAGHFDEARRVTFLNRTEN